MRTLEFQSLVTAQTSITHNGGDSYGINQKLRREKFVQPDYSVEEIPVISGNGVRGHLRDVGMAHMCRTLGISLDVTAFHFLFSGGSLTGDGSKSIDIDEIRRLRTLIPLVGLLGGAHGNAILPGRANIGKMIPICVETAHLLPERFTSGKNFPSFTAFVQEEMYTRKDDAKNEHLNAVITAPQRKLLDDTARAKRSKSIPQEDTGQHQQMRYYVETLAAGTPFFWQVTLTDVTELEYEAFAVLITEWSKRPVVGGKAGIGLGRVSVSCEEWISVDSRIADASTVASPIGKLYETHLRDNAEAIRQVLGAMASAA